MPKPCLAQAVQEVPSIASLSVSVGAGSRQIEIVDGLQPGDRIAVAGVTFLREGMKVSDLGDALGGSSR